MGRRGPKATPTPILKLVGSKLAKKRLHEAKADPAPVGSMRPPEWLRKSKVSKIALEEWQRLVCELDKLGVLAQIDSTSLGLCCHAFGEYIRAMRMVDRDGITTTTDKGNIIQHPAVGMANTAWARYFKAAAEFGLTPASRSGLKTSDPTPAGSAADEAKRFLFGA